MPGIVGIITGQSDDRLAEQQVKRMVTAMLHQPSYVHGTFSLPALGCYVGWVNHPNTYADGNPVTSPDGQVVIVFAGEHFSHAANGNGGASGRKGAHEVLSLYETKGPRFVDELNGFFSGVIIDRPRGEILLFNDRFGVGRVYIHEVDDVLTFASEAKAILSVRPDTRSLDAQGVGQFMGFGTVFNNRTLFANVSLLPAGSCWDMSRPSEISRRQYFHPKSWAEQPHFDPSTFYSALRQTMARVLPSYFRAASPVGLSLTGGLDTRIVMAGMPVDLRGSHSMPAYTYGGVYRECFDVQVAREVAHACGQPHLVLGLGADFFQKFDRHAEETVWVTDGSLDLCGTHEIYYSRLARELSPIRLTGNYGSEVLRSVSTFKFTPPSETLFDRGLLPYTTEASRAFADLRAGHPVTFSAFAEVPWNLFGRLAAAQSQLVLRSPYMDNDVVALMYQAPPNTRETNETSLQLIADLNPGLARIGTDMGFGGLSLAPVARARQLARYLQFKAEWYYNAGMPQLVARYERRLPLRVFEPLFLGRHKIDHYRLWFQDQVRPFVTDVLTDSRTASRPYLNPKGYAALVDAHLNRRGNCLNAINKTVTLELVQRQLTERLYPS